MAKSASPKLNRSVVVDMAASVADAEGLDAVSLSRIAADAGVTQPALYKHVSGIDELMQLLALRARDLLATQLQKAVGKKSRDRAVSALASAWRAFVREHPGLYAATDRVPSIGDAEIEESLAHVVGVITSALAGYALTKSQRDESALALRSALHGFCILEKDQGHPRPESIDKNLAQLVKIFCRGVESLERPNSSE